MGIYLLVKKRDNVIKMYGHVLWKQNFLQVPAWRRMMTRFTFKEKNGPIFGVGVDTVSMIL